jgi:hypothetical protein
MKRIIVGIIVIFLIGGMIYGQPGKTPAKKILPVASFSRNFMNFPQAWTTSTGKDVKAGVVIFDETERKKQVQWLKAFAPGADIRFVPAADLYNGSVPLHSFDIFMVQHPPLSQSPQLLEAILKYSKAGKTFVLPAYTGPMKADHDYGKWLEFIKKASTSAVIAGVHGKTYQLGNLEFRKNAPADIYAMHHRIQDNRYFNPNSLVKEDLELGVYYVTGAIALLKAKEPQLTPKEIKQRLKKNSRSIYWCNITWEETPGKREPYCRPFLNRQSMDKWMKRQRKKKIVFKETFRGHSLDAALLLGLPPMDYGQWTYDLLNIKEAQKHATGKGVTVAILDHWFDPGHKSLKGRIKKPGSVVEGLPVFQKTPGHGTWMAEDLSRTAPGVSIMPVRFCGGDRYGDPDLYIKGIEYAVDNGADIISISHRAIPKDRLPDLDSAVQKASDKGVTVVYIHYYGPRKDVIVPGPIEFAGFKERGEMIYVIGTNFIDEQSFPYTWGVSQTAPIVSGVIALMKQLNPRLKPREIKEILLKSTITTPDGYPLLDAKKAADHVKGTHMPAAKPSLIDAHGTLITSSKPGSYIPVYKHVPL